MKFIRKILKGVSLTAAMFVFQACYGEPPDWPEYKINFRVVSDEDGTPIKDIKVASQPQSDNENVIYDWKLLGYTDSNGFCSGWLYEPPLDIKFRFSDNDSVYAVKDTIFSNLSNDTIDIVLTKVQ